MDASRYFRHSGAREARARKPDYFSLVKMIVPLAANMPPTPWQTEIFAP
jgi:hypothetical protein